MLSPCEREWNGSPARPVDAMLGQTVQKDALTARFQRRGKAKTMNQNS
ncbi:hypothetical protein DENIT_170019 [Pseudomonas veronii]|nr:hypothetical protein DENIT_170019 [Pseudomonas veronii]